jgi:hypothetical protein
VQVATYYYDIKLAMPLQESPGAPAGRITPLGCRVPAWDRASGPALPGIGSGLQIVEEEEEEEASGIHEPSTEYDGRANPMRFAMGQMNAHISSQSGHSEPSDHAHPPLPKAVPSAALSPDDQCAGEACCGAGATPITSLGRQQLDLSRFSCKPNLVGDAGQGGYAAHFKSSCQAASSSSALPHIGLGIGRRPHDYKLFLVQVATLELSLELYLSAGDLLACWQHAMA